MKLLFHRVTYLEFHLVHLLDTNMIWFSIYRLVVAIIFRTALFGRYVSRCGTFLNHWHCGTCSIPSLSWAILAQKLPPTVPYFCLPYAVKPENCESLERVQDTENVLEKQASISNGHGSKNPGKTKKNHNGESHFGLKGREVEQEECLVG